MSLRNCPFCGSVNLSVEEAVVSMRQGLFDFYIQCNSCYATGPTNKIREIAIDGWGEERKKDKHFSTVSQGTLNLSATYNKKNRKKNYERPSLNEIIKVANQKKEQKNV